MNDKNFGWIWTLLTVVLAVILIFFVVKGALFIGWAIGGVIGVILAVCIIAGVLNFGSFIGTFIGLLILIWIIDFFI